MLTVSEAQERMLSSVKPVNVETIPIGMALGRVLAADVMAPFDLPLFTNSSMDGFAVISKDIQQAAPGKPVTLSVVGEIRAGQEAAGAIHSGQAMRIMTGAMLPDGADAVVPVEMTDQNDRSANPAKVTDVKIYQSVVESAYIRLSGQDVHRNQILLRSSSRLRPQDIGLLAMFGLPTIEVFCQPRIAIFSTGDELLPVGAELQAGKIYQSNSYALAAQIQQAGAVAIDLGVAPDRIEAVKQLFDQAVAQRVDMIISSAGVSVGVFDFVRRVIEEQGSLNFWKVNMRPGKPITYGTYKDIPFVGLPGNPVSAFMCFEVFVRSALLRMSGVSTWFRDPSRVRLAEGITSDGRESYLRAIVSKKGGNLVAHLTGNQDSGNLNSLVQANAFLIVPSEVKSLPIGAELDAWLMGDVKNDDN